MKAVIFEKTGGPEVLKIAEVPKPEVKPGMVLIKVRAAWINFADTSVPAGAVCDAAQVSRYARPLSALAKSKRFGTGGDQI